MRMAFGEVKVPWDDMFFNGSLIVSLNRQPPLEATTVEIYDPTTRTVGARINMSVRFSEEVKLDQIASSPDENERQRGEMLLDGILHNALDLCSDLEKNGRKYLSLNNPMTCPTPDGCFIVHRAWRPSILLKADGWKLSVAPTTHNEGRRYTFGDELRLCNGNYQNLIGTEVDFRHRKGSGKVVQIDPSKTINTKMPPRPDKPDEPERTFGEYFQKRYARTAIVYKDLPLVGIENEFRGEKQIAWFPAELLEFPNMKRFPRDQDDTIKDELTSEPPASRIRYIEMFMEIMNSVSGGKVERSAGEEIKRWGVAVSQSPDIVPFHKIPGQRIHLARDSVSNDSTKWMPQMRDLDITQGSPMDPCLVLFDERASSFAQTMAKNFEEMVRDKQRQRKNQNITIKIQAQSVPAAGGTNSKLWLENLERWSKSARTNMNKKLACLIVRHGEEEEVYADVCRWCLENNVVEQVVVASKHAPRVQKGGSYPKVLASNLFVGLQVKMGASLWKIGYNANIFDKDNSRVVMMIGCDVYHDISHKSYRGPNGESWPSTMAFTCEVPNKRSERAHV
eukprot:TRINITY_DN2404_c0_g1_i1.p1 TRINITY_DN2404_c0_g1~~TRINITY_DN2404_c0_g1_i1.p1  ORF type:complete len:656 (-),score=86.34 TRINITY_DN2404_c0_g1_i1:125-1816(-)